MNMSTTTATNVNSTESQYKKKSTPGGAPLNLKLINDTPPGSKNQWLAEFLLDHIGDRDHPMKRPNNRSVDRVFRGLITERNATGQDTIINV